MTENMGQAPQELPLGTPPPLITPPEGVVISRVEADGWTRKYLYQAKRGMGDRILENSLLIAEIPPGSVRAPLRPEVPLQLTPVVVRPTQEAVPPAPPPPPVQQGMNVPGMAGAMRVPGRAVSSPFSGVRGAEANLPPQNPQLAGSNLPVLSNPTPPRSLRLSQGPGSQSPSSVPGAACPPPGPMQLPDGRIIQLDDTIKLSDLWQILPYMTQQCVQQAKAEGPQQAPVGPQSAIPTSPIGAGFPGFGPATGMFGTGPFGGPGGGGALPGPLGVVSGNVPQPQPGGSGIPGPAGPPGPPGPAGLGTGVDFLVKTDGDFSAGPGAFIPVPGTLLSFTQGQAGPAVFMISGAFGCNFPDAQSDVLGIEVDGTPISLQAVLRHTFVGGVGDFYNPCSALYAMQLAAGQHTVQILLRGFGAGESCQAAGLGNPAIIAANADVPLSLIVQHPGVGAPAPGAPILVVDGIAKTDANFNATGGLTAVPGTQVGFTVNTPGNVEIKVSADFAANPKAPLPAISLGIIIDGGTPLQLASFAENNGAGSDGLFGTHLTGIYVIALSTGPHSVQMAYNSSPGPELMTLIASPAQPAVITVIHP